MPMEIAKVKAACEEFRLAGYRMEKIAKTTYEQLKSAGVPCGSPYSYHGLAEWINVEKNGMISIEEKKDDKKFEYFCISVNKKYVKPIKSVMKDLGIEEYIYSPPANHRR
jgi:hypothetical protein